MRNPKASGSGEAAQAEAVMTPTDKWAADYRRKLDHKIELWKIREAAEARQRADAALRRREEQVSVQCYQAISKSEGSLARMHAASGGKYGRPRSVKAAARELRRIREDDPNLIDPEARRYAAHVAKLAAQLGVTVVYVDSEGAWTNTHAWTKLKRIEIPVVRTAWRYASGLHELGHCANPCQPSHRRVATGERGKTVCVRCETSAWRWAQREALAWIADIHANMDAALASYATYGTAAEQREIAEMTSGLAFRQMQLHKLKGRTA
jgi:hypothetical protein